jgi:hypothetical protein
MVHAITPMDINVRHRSEQGVRPIARVRVNTSGVKFSELLNQSQANQPKPSASYQSFESQIAAAKAATAFYATPSIISVRPQRKPLVAAVSEED